MLKYIDTSAVNALLIVGVTSFLVGVVIAYQGAVQLEKFGANIFIVEMICITMFREIAPLVTAIVIAGRSASSYTAEIGAMKITDEIDAMRTMDFEPTLFLVLPRIFALVIALPLLVFFADIIGIFGGMVIAYVDLDITFAEFVNRFWLSGIDEHSTAILDMINSAYSYTVYLFFDFAGYSAMAVGISIMMGINVPMNFNHPYLAPNPQDFWRRFHITLGTWLTDYFFKPLYKYLHNFEFLKGRRLLIQNLAIISTFLLMGMWNGFTWYFIFSGFLFGIYSAIHNIYVVYVKKGGFDYFSIFPDIISINLKRFLMLNGAVLALYFFSGRVPI